MTAKSSRTPKGRTECVATIDVGTNTLLLVVAELHHGSNTYRLLHDESEITQLGKGFYQEHRLQPDAVERTFAALERYARRCESLDVEEIAATGTSVLRDATNGEAFLQSVEERYGIPIEVISGEEEARLSYLAVRRDPVLNLPANSVRIVADIGGGSTELIIGDEKIRQMVSLDAGSVRVTEAFLHSDPPTKAEIVSLRTVLEEMFQDAPKSAEMEVFVGVGGTAATLANIAVHRQSPMPEVHGYRLSRDELDGEINLFSRMTDEERKSIPGLEAKRAGVILGGGLIVERIMAHYGMEEMVTSVRGIRFGALYDRFMPDEEWMPVE